MNKKRIGQTKAAAALQRRLARGVAKAAAKNTRAAAPRARWF